MQRDAATKVVVTAAITLPTLARIRKNVIALIRLAL